VTRAKAVVSAEDEAALGGPARRATLNRLLFPGPARTRAERFERFGDVSRLPSIPFWYGLRESDDDIEVELGVGVRLLIGLEAIGEPGADGMRTVVFRLNGQMRPIDARDTSVSSTTLDAEKIDPSEPGHVGAPFRGIASVTVAVGDVVESGQVVATIEAMKMESSISAPTAGTVARVINGGATAVEPGDLLCEIQATTTTTPITPG